MTNQVFIKVESVRKFREICEHLDLPINSNVVLVTGDYQENMDLWDVYRPSPGAEIRSGNKQRINEYWQH